MAQVKITETVLRDGHQSIAATRMRLNQMLPALEAMDEIGYNALECWGGATFDTCMRFLDEDPWERLRTIKKHVTKTPLQMLFRGQNILGYRHYADDVVYEFVNRAVDNGIDIIRVFDALNDHSQHGSGYQGSKGYEICSCSGYTGIHNQSYPYIGIVYEGRGGIGTNGCRFDMH